MNKKKVYVHVEDPYVSAYVFSSLEAARKVLDKHDMEYIQEQELDPEVV